ncbi:unnamed protein product [Paramecium sonneborni]|uniref:Transmembrane protein n=1 Tax=Paramecium sonneborni TaxID=65129 RepID=A0A8S1Q901_9CILI|nr:unnamed protein product [Paramecium sonneborni]
MNLQSNEPYDLVKEQRNCNHQVNIILLKEDVFYFSILSFSILIPDSKKNQIIYQFKNLPLLIYLNINLMKPYNNRSKLLQNSNIYKHLIEQVLFVHYLKLSLLVPILHSIPYILLYQQRYFSLVMEYFCIKAGFMIYSGKSTRDCNILQIAFYSLVNYQSLQLTVTFIDDIFLNQTESIKTGFTNGSITSMYGLYDKTPCYDSKVLNFTRFGLRSDMNPQQQSPSLQQFWISTYPLSYSNAANLFINMNSSIIQKLVRLLKQSKALLQFPEIFNPINVVFQIYKVLSSYFTFIDVPLKPQQFEIILFLIVNYYCLSDAVTQIPPPSALAIQPFKSIFSKSMFNQEQVESTQMQPPLETTAPFIGVNALTIEQLLKYTSPSFKAFTKIPPPTLPVELVNYELSKRILKPAKNICPPSAKSFIYQESGFQLINLLESKLLLIIVIFLVVYLPHSKYNTAPKPLTQLFFQQEFYRFKVPTTLLINKVGLLGLSVPFRNEAEQCLLLLKLKFQRVTIYSQVESINMALDGTANTVVVIVQY